MHLPAIAILSLALANVAMSEPEGTAGPSPLENVIDRLLSERDSANALQEAIAEARKLQVSEQAILEARFLFHVDRQEDDAIAALLPEFMKRRDDFKIGDSVIFAVKEDWHAVVEYVQAIAALKNGNKAAFKTHITEAFWLSPRQASAFAPHIDRLRLEETMSAVKINFETKLSPLLGGDAVTLKDLSKNKKATVLHFWSPAGQEAEASLATFVIAAKVLEEKGMAVISISPDGSAKILTDGKNLLAKLGPQVPGAWLLDPKENSLSQQLRVQSLPVFVLISDDGKILFNGDPSDDALWEALKKIDPQIARPELPKEQE